MAWTDAIGAIAGGVLGGVIGGSPDPESTRTSQVQDITLRNIDVLNQGRSNLEASATASQEALFGSLNQLVGAGPGQSDIAAAMAAQQGYGNLLQQQMAEGGLPSQGQIGAGQQYAQNIFAPQQLMLQQQFNQERVNQQRLAARLGRRANDPVLANKLAFSQGQLQQNLSAQQGAFAAQTAMSLPERQALLAERLASVRGGLASQALQNRVALLNMGNQLSASERQYRINTARRGTTRQENVLKGGGEGQMLAGVVGGIGQFGGAISEMFGGTAAGVGGYAEGGATGLGAATASGIATGATVMLPAAQAATPVMTAATPALTAAGTAAAVV